MNSLTNMKVGPPYRSFVLPFGLVRRQLFAGPYANRPAHMVGVKLAPEVKGGGTPLLYLPIEDFGVPEDNWMTDVVVHETLVMLADNSFNVYVGCRGGRGRTGLFLALLAKSLGVRDPVNYVRTRYDPHAIETKGQEEFLSSYRSPLLGIGRLKLKLRALVRGKGFD